MSFVVFIAIITIVSGISSFVLIKTEISTATLIVAIILDILATLIAFRICLLVYNVKTIRKMRFLLAMTFFVMVNLILTYGLYDVIKPSAYVYPSLQWTVYLTVLIPLNILIFYLSLRIYNISDIKFKKNLFTITYDIIIKKPVLFVELLLYPLILWVLAELILYPLIKFTIYNFWPSIIPLSATLPIQFIYITFHIFVLNEVVKLMLLLTIMIVTFFTILICLKMFSRFTHILLATN